MAQLREANKRIRLLEQENEHGIVVGENRVRRLCRVAGITASHHKKRSKAGSTGPAPHDDLLAVVDEHGVVRHEFVADGPSKVWLWAISEHPTREGKLYICARSAASAYVSQSGMRRNRGGGSGRRVRPPWLRTPRAAVRGSRTPAPASATIRSSERPPPDGAANAWLRRKDDQLGLRGCRAGVTTAPTTSN